VTNFRKAVTVLVMTATLTGLGASASFGAAGGEDNHCNSNKPGCHHK